MKNERLLQISDVPTLGEFCDMSPDGIRDWVYGFGKSARATGLGFDDDDRPRVRSLTLKGLAALAPYLDAGEVRQLRALVQHLAPRSAFKAPLDQFLSEFADTPLNVLKYRIANCVGNETESTDFDPFPLIEFIEEILIDEEVSADEAYSLAEYLNNDPAACDNWPGDRLVAKLQELWADGDAEEIELRDLADTLAEIVHEFESRGVEKTDLGESAIGYLDEWEPLTPSVPATLQVESESEQGLCYTVDLASPSCTCEDWTDRRSRLPQRHIGRCCKHILTAFRENRPVGGWPSWVGGFFQQSWTPHPKSNWRVIDVDGAPILISDAPREWNDVYAPDGPHGYRRYGFNAEETRWAYSEAPKNALEIRRALKGMR